MNEQVTDFFNKREPTENFQLAHLLLNKIKVVTGELFPHQQKQAGQKHRTLLRIGSYICGT